MARTGGSGNIVATSDDMAKWLLYHVNQTLQKDKKYIGIDPKLIDETKTEQNKIPQKSKTNFDVPDLTKVSYGLGWYIGTYRGKHNVMSSYHTYFDLTTCI